MHNCEYEAFSAIFFFTKSASSFVLWFDKNKSSMVIFCNEYWDDTNIGGIDVVLQEIRKRGN